MRNINEIVIHHSSNKSSYEEIKRLHKVQYRWDDIGYHFLINKEGGLLNGRLLEKEGAHVLGHNKNSVGVCLIGNFDEEKPTKRQIAKLIEILNILKKKFKVSNDRIKGHREFPNVNKSCPGKNVSMEKIRRLLDETNGQEK